MWGRAQRRGGQNQREIYSSRQEHAAHIPFKGSAIFKDPLDGLKVIWFF